MKKQYFILVLTIVLHCAFCLSSEGEPVNVIDEAETFSISNQIITARVSKRNGDLLSMKYKQMEMMEPNSGHGDGYWSHTPVRGWKVTASLTIDPAKNGGQRGEIAVKGIYQQGITSSKGPGGSANCDIEIRYSLGQDDSGLYTYCILGHQKGYPATSIGEARFAAKLNGDIFDHMTIDQNRKKIMHTAEDWNKGIPQNMKEVRLMTTGIYKGEVEHKYDYSAIQFQTPAFGWSSTKKQIGFWMVNPTIEYLSGGPTKVELTCHRDLNTAAAPTILNYWRGSHYGGSSCNIAADENWSKVIGPFLLYCNSTDSKADSQDALWKDALQKAATEAARWPYEWVDSSQYPRREMRSTVSGQITIVDPESTSKTKPSNLLVGLTAPDYSASSSRGGMNKIDWQMDAKYYQFWVKSDETGHFKIPTVREGKYTLHAIADGVLGEFARTDITVTSGKSVDLGKLEWKPLRNGKPIWEIGIADRTASEFKHGDHYWQWGLYNQYAAEFPHDVDFTIGKSIERTDWNYCQVASRNKETTWKINFALPDSVKGKATLRLSIAGATMRSLAVGINGTEVGNIKDMIDNGAIRRDGIRGYWLERSIPFDAALLKQGNNILSLTIPQGSTTSGVEYDYLRLELAPAAID